MKYIFIAILVEAIRECQFSYQNCFPLPPMSKKQNIKNYIGYIWGEENKGGDNCPQITFDS